MPPLGEKVEGVADLKLAGIGEHVGADVDPLVLDARFDQRVVGDGVPISNFSACVLAANTCPRVRLRVPRQQGGAPRWTCSHGTLH